MDFDDNFEFSSRIGRSVPMTSTAPLTDCVQKEMDDLTSKHKINFMRLTQPHNRGDVAFWKKLEPQCYPLIFWEPVTQYEKKLRKVVKSARGCFDLMTSDTGFPAELRSNLESTNITSRLIDLYSRLTVFEEGLAKLADVAETLEKKYITVKTDHIVIISAGPGGCLLKLSSGWYSCTEDMLAMVVGVMRQRFTLELLLCTSLIPGADQHLIWKIIDIQEEALRGYGNAGFDLVKSTEALGKAINIRLGGGVIDGLDPLLDMEQKYLEKEKKLNTETPITKRMIEAFKEIKDDATAQTAFSISKICGHPILDVSASSISMRDLGKDQGSFTGRGVIELEATVKYLVIESQLRKGCWPPFAVPPKIGTKLHDFYKIRSMALTYESCPLTDYLDVRFKKIYDCKAPEDGLQLFDDKTIAGYDSTIMDGLYNKQEGKESTRLIEATLLGGEVNLEDVYEKFKAGKVPKEWMIVAITLKGGELKPIGRGFAMFCKEIRALLSDMERRLADGFMNDIPYQTMTLGKKQAMRRLCKATRNPLALQVESDLSRWNLRWKGRVVNVIGGVLDQIYGEPGVWSRLHTFFSECTIMMRMPGYMPKGSARRKKLSEMPESDLVWRKHLAGFEGQAQKMWTICTIAMMLMATRGMDCTTLLTGQGDNQIEEVTRGKSDMRTDTEFMKEYLRRKAETCASVGQELKPEECIVGKRRVTYSKYFYQDGYEVYPAAKALIKVLSPPSEGLRSLSQNISGISAAALAGAPSLRQPSHAAFIGYVGGVMAIDTEVATNSLGSRMPAIELRSRLPHSLVTPACLGGLMTLNLYSLHYKGYTDAPGLALAAFNRLTDPTSRSIVAGAVNGPVNADPKRLIDDPLAFPLEGRGVSPQTVLDKVTRSVVRSMAMSGVGSVSSVLAQSDDREYDQLSSVLSRSVPFYPLVCRAIVDASVQGVCRSLMSRLNHTKTIIKRSSVYSSISPYTATRIADRELLRALSKRISNARHNMASLADMKGYELVELMRRRWGVLSDNTNLVKGVSTIPVCDLLVESGMEVHFYNRSPPASQEGPVKRDAYQGPGTGQKRAYGDLSVAIDSQAMRDIKALSLISTQLSPGPGLSRLISQIAQTRTRWPVDVIMDYLPRTVGGTSAHRHDIWGRAAFDLGVNGREPHQVYISSDDVKTDGDYPIVFQEVYCFGTTVTSCLIRSRPRDQLTQFTMRLNLDKVPEISDSPPDLVTDFEPKTPPPNKIFTASVKSVVDRRTNLIVGSFKRDSGCHEMSCHRISLLIEAKTLAILGRPDVLSSAQLRVLPSGMATQFIDRREYDKVGHKLVVAGLSKGVARLSLYVAASRGDIGLRSYPLISCISDLSVLASKLIVEHSCRSSKDNYLSSRGVEYTTGEGGMIAFGRRLAGLISSRAMLMIEKYPEVLLEELPVFDADCPNATFYIRWYISCALHLEVIHSGSRLVTEVVRALWRRLNGVEEINPDLVGPTFGIMLRDAGGAGVSIEHAKRALGGSREPAFTILHGSPVESLRPFRTMQRPEILASKVYFIRGKAQEPCRYVISSRTAGYVRLVHRVAERVDALHLLMRSLERHSQMIGGIHTGAGCQWSRTSILEDCSGKRCYVAGAGNGAVMALLRQVGATVSGLDLLSNLPESADISSYSPPEVRAIGDTSTLEKMGVLRGGDFFSVGKESVLRFSPDVCVIDLESGSRGFEADIEVIRGLHLIVYIRLFTTVGHIEEIIGSCLECHPTVFKMTTDDEAGGSVFIIKFHNQYRNSGQLRHSNNVRLIPSKMRRSRLESPGLEIISSALLSMTPRSVSVTSTSIDELVRKLIAMHSVGSNELRLSDLTLMTTCVSCVGTLLICKLMLEAHRSGNWSTIDYHVIGVIRGNLSHLEFQGRRYPVTWKTLLIASKGAGRYIAGCEVEELDLDVMLAGEESV